MDALLEVIAIEPTHISDPGKLARAWKVGDIVDVRGIKPALAQKNGNGDYIPLNPVQMPRTRYVFVKNIPDIGIERLKQILCRQENNILNGDLLRKSMLRLDISEPDRLTLINDGYLNIDVTNLLGRTRYKTADRLVTVEELSG